jgi:branched-chain amino acid transport system substrate-binding protein
MKRVLRRLAVLVATPLLPLAAVASAAFGAPAGPPIKIGGTLALTGPLGSTAIVHKIAAEIYLEQLNKRNGLLGRPVEYVLLDDQSKPEVARTLYERLITVDKVDLIMGAHATAMNLAAMGVAQRYGKLFLASTMLKQIQNGRWVTVWPKQWAAPGVSIVYPSPGQ